MSSNVGGEFPAFVQLLKERLESIQIQLSALDVRGQEREKLLQEIRMDIVELKSYDKRISTLENKVGVIREERIDPTAYNELKKQVESMQSRWDQQDGAGANQKMVWGLLVAAPGILALLGTLLRAFGGS